MIPAFLLAKPLWVKIVVPLGLLLTIYGLYWGWREYQQSVGRREVKLAQAIELQQQAREATAQLAREKAISDRKVNELIINNETLETKYAKVQKEIDRYAKRDSPPLDLSAIRIVNELAGVLNAPPTSERVPDADEAVGGAVVEETTCANTADLLQRIKDLTRRWELVDERHRLLSEDILEKYESQMQLYQGLPTEAKGSAGE